MSVLSVSLTVLLFKFLLIFVPTSRGFMFDPPAGFPRPPGFGYLLMGAPGAHQAPLGAVLATTIQPYVHGSLYTAGLLTP
jgi:hypothetical protein